EPVAVVLGGRGGDPFLPFLDRPLADAGLDVEGVRGVLVEDWLHQGGDLFQATLDDLFDLDGIGGVRRDALRAGHSAVVTEIECERRAPAQDAWRNRRRDGFALLGGDARRERDLERARSRVLGRARLADAVGVGRRRFGRYQFGCAVAP